jgi:hypothetical protein
MVEDIKYSTKDFKDPKHNIVLVYYNKDNPIINELIKLSKTKGFYIQYSDSDHKNDEGNFNSIILSLQEPS